MPAHFFDTCAIVYRYFQAPESAAVDTILAAPGLHYVSRLGVTEFHKTFAGLVRGGKLTPAGFDRKVEAFERDVATGLIVVAPVKNPRFRDAERYIRLVGMTADLGSQDAIQLAVALHLRVTFKELKLVTCERALLAAAAALQLPTICP